ncbi:MAG: GTPase HflX [Deltaproteobacteria bacterium RIFCSPLOWO2_01_44_7]|nr:MAG: GTPase HflX [Deltaproteobacteria bacterium RIFCSPLOWO2_01_44_7]
MAFPVLKPAANRERVLLTAVRRKGQSRYSFEASSQELVRLVDTAGGIVVEETSQEIDHPHPKTFLGKGKVIEISEKIHQASVDSVAIDDELSPNQNQHLEKAFNVKVVDRTAVILDIFAKRAHAKEGRLQVELAQLQYIQPRLKGMWSHFSKQTGGIGTRGPGETQLEVDRRRLKERLGLLRRRLEEVKTHRQIHRLKREAVPYPLFSLVGYTNAGKSTLFNTLTHADVFVEDKLFATLDPIVRRLKLPGGRQVLIADTVGFIRKLPHSLIEAFKATFEEIAHADCLIHVVDASDPEVYQQMETVSYVLAELGLNQKPIITVFNKKDQGFELNGSQGVPISALNGEGLPDLLAQMEVQLRKNCQQVTFFLPHTRGDILSNLYSLGHMVEVQHEPDGIRVCCEIDPKFVKMYQEFLIVSS